MPIVEYGDAMQVEKAETKLGTEALIQVAAMFASLSDSRRLALVQELKQGELGVGELVQRTGIGQASVSKHLKQLLDQGLVSRRADGVRAYYSLSGSFVMELCELVCGRLAEQQRQRIDFGI